MRSIGKTWNKPFYARYDKLPKIHAEEKIDMLISRVSPRMALMPSMSKDMGTRPVELTWLKVADINLQNGIVNITVAKHAVGRNGELKMQTLEMLKKHITAKRLSNNDRLFPCVGPSVISENYGRLRNALAERLQDPTFKEIRLYNLRHFKARIEYNKTNNLLYVKALLGHKDLRTTLRYAQLLENLPNDEFHCSVAKNIQEATNLI